MPTNSFTGHLAADVTRRKGYPLHIMGYRDTEYPNPLDLFPANGLMSPVDTRLQKRLKSIDGISIHRAQQLYHFDEETAQEFSLTVEFDRFAAGLKKTDSE